MQQAIQQKVPSQRVTELWHVGIAHAPIGALLAPGALARTRITWLPPQRNFTFIADPFAVTRDGVTSVFVEALDYRRKRGEIHYYQYDAEWNLLSKGVALRERSHLSYPFLIEDGGETYMLPEAHRSGRLTLYRAERFPDRWVQVKVLMEQPAIDASVIRHGGKWWMFYALPGPDGRAMRELHVAHADMLTGPWTPHTGNPVRSGLCSARPGGTPFVHEGTLHLPVQDCTEDYGKAVQVLRVDTLTTEAFSASPVARFTADGLYDAYTDGLHTLSACGAVTVLDVKRSYGSPKRRVIDITRKLRKALGLI